MKKLTIREIQKLQLDILSALHEFCKENKITYSLGCGSMLGCARHKGYIPWDDDIDIYLLRDDFNKLTQEFPELYQNRYKLLSLDRSSSWDRAYAKISDCETILIEDGDSKINNLGVNIDVYPIDKVPEEMSEFLSYNKRRRLFQHLYELKFVKISNKREIHKNIILALSKIILLPFSKRFIAKILNFYAQKFNNLDTKMVFECCQGLMQKRPFSIELFSDIELLPFEDRMYMGFRNYDSYLSNAYGNWQKLPPENQRVSHHGFEAFWKS